MTEKQKAAVLSPGAMWKLAALSILIFIFLFSTLLAASVSLQQVSGLGVVLTTPQAATTPEVSRMIHSFPDTSEGIHIFSDQLAVWEMSEAQFEFVAKHYTGTQKVFASDARRFRSHNPNFIVLNYRLGLGLGYQGTRGNCQPDGVWTEVIEGEKRIREYPDNPPDEWFFKWQGQRVFFCDWGWYVMDVSDPSWREYWTGEVLRQLRANAADGVFMDSMLSPNYYGGDRFDPNLPVVDQTFEEAWSSRIENFIAYSQSGDLAEYYLIPNVGAWINGRDMTDYSGTDGVMVEGFGRWADGQYFSAQAEDWQMQMGRILRLVGTDKILLLQQYLINKDDVEDRLFLVGSYLLIKGQHTYLNLEVSTDPEWFPEYEIPIGAPLGGVPRSISSLWRSDWGVYARRYTNGLVLVNPSDQPQEITFPQTYYRAFPVGGGIVPADGDVSAWKVSYVPVTTITLMPNQCAILLEKVPQN